MKALQYALLAKAAYSTAPTIGREDGAARAIISDTDDGQVISFPGTNNIATWLADLNVDTVNVIGLGELHEGFWDAFNDIRSPLMQNSPAVTCGHSEGAALALIYAAALCFIGKPPKAVYAFEPPRISCDPTIKALFVEHGVQVYLYQNGNDIVPDVPRLIHDWQHPGQLIRIGEASEPFPNVTDHMIDNVIGALMPQPQVTQLRD
jgi:predicted lipase